MRKYRSQRIQKTLIALSGAALASTMMFSSAQNKGNLGNLQKRSNNYYTTKIVSQLHKAKKGTKEQKHSQRRKNVKKKLENNL